MRPTIDYLKRLVAACEDAPGATFTVEDLRGGGLTLDSEFQLHMFLLADRGHIERAQGERRDLGLCRAVDGNLHWNVVDLRLTADGHDFAANLRAPRVMETIREKAAEAGFAVWVQVAGAVVENTVKGMLGIDE